MIAFVYLFCFTHYVFAGEVQDGISAYEKKQWDEAKTLWWTSALAGDAQAQFFLSVLYSESRWKNYSLRQSISWLEQSANNNFPPALYNLGNLFIKGHIKAKNSLMGAILWKKSAEAGFVPAQFNLAVAFETGMGLPLDKKHALFWYKKAKQGGSEQAIERLSRWQEKPKGSQLKNKAQLGLLSNNKKQDGERDQARPSLVKRTKKVEGSQIPQEFWGFNPAWVKRQPRSNYTLQLYSGKNKASAITIADRLSEKIPLAVALFAFTKNGGIWYSTIVGSFVSYDEAKKASQKIEGVKPWIRRFANIHLILIESE